MSWVAAAMGGLSVAKGIYGAVDANQTKQRNKGYINDAWRTAGSRMSTEQAQGSAANAESLNARGLVGGGMSPIHAAMLDGTTPGATDLASASQSRLQGEYALDRHALDASHTQALNENNATALNAEIGSAASGIQGAISAYGTGQDIQSMKKMGAGGAGGASSAARSPIASAILSGSSYDGVHPVDPLGDSTSAWHMPSSGGTSLGMGQSNAEFNTGAG